VLAGAVVRRTEILDATQVASIISGALAISLESAAWLERARHAHQVVREDPALATTSARALGFASRSQSGLTKAYCGYYFGPLQCHRIDQLVQVAADDESGLVIRAATIVAASRSAASPGHTAQPFSSETRSRAHIAAAWERPFIEAVVSASQDLSRRHAKTRGATVTADGLVIAAALTKSDLVIIDPPYSAVQYSRFYHVLEAIATGFVGDVSGAGRYPPRSLRPQSDFSKKSTARAAMLNLLDCVAASGASAIVTFPAYGASNGIEGDDLIDWCSRRFSVRSKVVSSQLSTLGGGAQSARGARRPTPELILSLRPKRHNRSFTDVG
jgi:hypothetical protein